MTERVVPRGFTVRSFNGATPRDRTVFGAFTVPAATPALPAVVSGARCYFAPPRAFGSVAAAAFDAAPDAVRWDGMVAALDPSTGADLRAVSMTVRVYPPTVAGPEPFYPRYPSRAESRSPREDVLTAVTLPNFAALEPARGELPREWFPGYDTNTGSWRVVASGAASAARVYCDAGALALLPQGNDAAPFVVAGSDPPYARALRTEYRGPVEGARVWRPVFSVGGVAFEGLPTWGESSPGFPAGWSFLSDVLADGRPRPELVFVEQTPDPAARRDPTPGGLLSVYYLDTEDPAGPALYTVAAPFASWAAGSVEATGRAAIT